MLEKEPDIEVIAVAVDGIDAIAKTLRYNPDLITLDIDMPHMDGFTFLRWLMKEKPTPVIMVSSLSDKKTVFKALDLGAVDFITKPTRRASSELRKIEHDLLTKVRSITPFSLKKLDRQKLSSPKTKHPPHALSPSRIGKIELIAIGSSTGGPQALQYILSALPGNIPVPIVISQHMPKGFTGPFAKRINQTSELIVKEAIDNEPLEPGKVFICPGGYHLLFRVKGGKIYTKLQPSSQNDRYTPSIDRMLLSAYEIYKKRLMGIILTGMGSDGKEGMIAIHNCGGYTVAESEETAIVYGMPQEVIKANAARTILPLQRIPAEIIRVVMNNY